MRNLSLAPRLLGCALLVLALGCDGSSSPTAPSGSPTPNTPTPNPGGAVAALASVTLASAETDAGDPVQGTVALTAAAPAGGFVVTLSSSDKAASVPVSITIAAGASSGGFTVATTSVDFATDVTITAAAGSVTRTAALNVEPAVGQGPIESITMPSDDIAGGDDTDATILFSEPVPAGGARLAISSDAEEVIVPASVIVPAGSKKATFEIQTLLVDEDKTVTVTVAVAPAAAGGAHGIMAAKNKRKLKIQLKKIRLDSISPPSGVRGSTVEVEIQGSNIPKSAKVFVKSGLITVTQAKVQSSSRIAATFNIDPGTGPDLAQIGVTLKGKKAKRYVQFEIREDTPPPPPDPTLTGISPASGPTAGGGAVILTGTNLSGATDVTFGGTPAAAFTVNSATSITAIAPAHAALLVDVVVTTPGGSDTLDDAFTYLNTPGLTSVTPATGAPGETKSVVLRGTSFHNGTTTVNIAGSGVTASNVVWVSSTWVNASFAVAANAAPGARAVTVTTAGGTTSSVPFTVSGPPPSLIGVNPDAGSTEGGALVTITGTNLTGATGLTFGGAPVEIFNIYSDTGISAVTPAHAAGSVDVVVTTPNGTGTLVDAFTFETPATPPTLTGISPASGTTEGGDTVNLTGTNLDDVTSVTFGGTAASILNTSANSLTVTTLGHAAGTVDVAVTSPDGSDTLDDAFTFEEPAAPPTLTGITPESGLTDGGLEVTLTGTNLHEVTAVTFGGTLGSSLAVDSATSIRVRTPSHAPGAVDVVVMSPNGSATIANGFTYVVPDVRPTIVEVNPAIGDIFGGTPVTITGTNFLGVTSVTFGGTAATVMFSDATTILVTAPAHAAGLVDVVVTTPDGTATLEDGFKYVAGEPLTLALRAPAAVTESAAVPSGTDSGIRK
jgi:hypothetical protein